MELLFILLSSLDHIFPFSQMMKLIRLVPMPTPIVRPAPLAPLTNGLTMFIPEFMPEFMNKEKDANQFMDMDSGVPLEARVATGFNRADVSRVCRLFY
jgi:hypothetical protein